MTVAGSQQWPNNDGVDFESCINVTVRNWVSFTGDDGIVLASGNCNDMRVPWPEPYGAYTPTRNVSIDGAVISSFSSAIKWEVRRVLMVWSARCNCACGVVMLPAPNCFTQATSRCGVHATSTAAGREYFKHGMATLSTSTFATSSYTTAPAVSACSNEPVEARGSTAASST